MCNNQWSFWALQMKNLNSKIEAEEKFSGWQTFEMIEKINITLLVQVQRGSNKHNSKALKVQQYCPMFECLLIFQDSPDSF